MKMLRTLAVAALMAVIGRPALAAITLPTTLTNEIQQIAVPRNPQFILFGRSVSGTGSGAESINYIVVNADGSLNFRMTNSGTGSAVQSPEYTLNVTYSCTGCPAQAQTAALGMSVYLTNSCAGCAPLTAWTYTCVGCGAVTANQQIGAPVMFTGTCAGCELNPRVGLASSPGASAYVWSDTTSSSTSMVYSIAIGPSGGATATIEGTALAANFLFAVAPITYSNTIMVVSTETVNVEPSGLVAQSYQMSTGAGVAVTGTEFFIVATTTGQAVKGVGMQVFNNTLPIPEYIPPYSYNPLGSTRYLATFGGETDRVNVQQAIQPVLGWSTQSVAQAAVNPGGVLFPGQILSWTALVAVLKANGSASTAQTVYFAILNYPAVRADTVCQVSIVKPQQ